MCHYLEGYYFIVVTDHQSLKWLDNIDNSTGCLARYAGFLPGCVATAVYVVFSALVVLVTYHRVFGTNKAGVGDSESTDGGSVRSS